MALLYLISAIGCAIAWDWTSLLVFRFLGGLGIGGSSVLGPVYISELAPARLRGRLVGLFQINIVVGILFAYLSNAIIASFHLGSTEWRWEFGIAAIPAFFFGVFLFAIPMSSRWLVTQNRIDEAREALRLLGSPDTEAELKEIVDSIHLDRAVRHESVFQKQYAKPLILAICLGGLTQLTGINAILYYLNDIFLQAGFSKDSSSIQPVIIGLTNLVATLIGMSLIDKLGRRTLLLIGTVGMVFALTGVGYIYSSGQYASMLLWLLVLFIFSFAISTGTVVWVYISEIFPNRVRSKGQSIGSAAHWILNAVIAAVFPWISSYSRSLPFFSFAIILVISFVFMVMYFPETKGKTLEEIQKEFHIN